MINKEEKLNQVYLLREKTGLSLLDCKHALIRNNWDIDKAIRFLVNKEKGTRFTI